MRLNRMAESPVRNPVLLELQTCPLCKQRLTSSHLLYTASIGWAGDHCETQCFSKSVSVRCIFNKHHLTLSLEKRECEPIRPNATGSDRGKYAVRMDGIFAFRSGKVVEIDFTWVLLLICSMRNSESCQRSSRP